MKILFDFSDIRIFINSSVMIERTRKYHYREYNGGTVTNSNGVSQRKQTVSAMRIRRADFILPRITNKNTLYAVLIM